jgi:hypothetical protein
VVPGGRAASRAGRSCRGARRGQVPREAYGKTPPGSLGAADPRVLGFLSESIALGMPRPLPLAV